jgi:all-trans-retinol 13,14-reductase
VLVLEQHDAAGGCTHTFFEKGYEFDTGLHYIGSPDFGLSGREGKLEGISLLMGTLCEGCEQGQLEWTRMADSYDIALQKKRGGTEDEYDRFEIPTGKERFETALVERFPAEKAAIRRYFDMIEEHQAKGGLFFGSKVITALVPTRIQAPLRSLLCGSYRSSADRTVKQVVDGLTDNVELKGILTCQWGDYGLPPAKASFAMHSMVASHYWPGAAYPVSPPPPPLSQCLNMIGCSCTNRTLTLVATL